jgi:glutathione synthase/RimK-type ligase-like ATP-grasp enzyme
MPVYVYPYKQGSVSARLLAENIGAKRIKREGSRFKGSPDKIVINWGCSELPEEVLKCQVINHPDKLRNATNKLKFFQEVENQANIPYFTTDINEAREWLGNGKTVVERHKLTGNSGEGIRLVEPDGELQQAPLYVQYVPKREEFRIHVMKGVVVDVQRKARRRDVEDEEVNWKIRNHDNGFIFQRNDVDCPDEVLKQAVIACNAVGLDFGAVDVIYNERQGKAYVLEVNCAPGLTGSTLDGYVNRMIKITRINPPNRQVDLDELLRGQRVFNGADARQWRA